MTPACAQSILDNCDHNLSEYEYYGPCVECVQKAITTAIAITEERVREALRSIADNTCCDSCQEAALVAQAALDAVKEAGNVVPSM